MSTAVQTQYSDKAKAAWELLPDWVAVLAEEIDKAGRIQPVAERIGYSASALSSVINGSYTGRLVHIENAVRRLIMTDRVECPVLGTIKPDRCERAQGLKRCPTINPQVVRLYRACNSGRCPFSKNYSGES